MSTINTISVTDTPYYLQRNSSSISSSVNLFLVACMVMTPSYGSLIMTPSYGSLNLNSFLENKTASRPGQSLNSSMIIFSNSATNESIYQTPKHSDWIAGYYKKLKELSSLPTNWDSYGAEPPNDIALNWTKEILSILFKIEFPPTRITPSVENGVGISFICDNKYADIECFNEGEILAVTSDGKGNPEVWEVETSTLGITSAIEKIRVFLQK